MENQSRSVNCFEIVKIDVLEAPDYVDRVLGVNLFYSLTEVYFLGFSWWLKRKEKKGKETERVPGQTLPRPRAQRLQNAFLAWFDAEMDFCDRHLALTHPDP